MTQNNSEITGDFLERVEERIKKAGEGRIPFSVFLEEQMDLYDYSNTSLARVVFHKTYKKKEGRYVYSPVTRQAIGTWLRGSMPSSREIYVTLGMAFHMSLTEINHILLETYMGYGLYCKNIEDALWIALIGGLFPMEEFDAVKEKIEEILNETDTETSSRSLPTMDLWELLAAADSLEDFYRIIREYREEFRNGARQFGIVLNEVVEEEYGYYEKASWFLRDIGCLHCEAQFSKIRAGKAVVTRDWLLRFCIALHPSLSSIEKLLAKAQMEPLGITPAEIIIEMISEEQSDLLSNSQQMWVLIEAAAKRLKEKGYEIDADLCRKYDAVYDMPLAQKLWFSICLGESLIDRQKNKDFGYTKAGYCRYHCVDAVLFDEVNRFRKSAAFKEAALSETGSWQPVESLAVTRTMVPDALDLEKFEDYCYEKRPSRFSGAFVMNDTYYYSALLYSVWTGQCFVKDAWEVDEITAAFQAEDLDGQGLAGLIMENLSADGSEYRENGIRRILDALYEIRKAAGKKG